MISEFFLTGAIVLQITAAVLAFRLTRITGRLSAWILISIALALMSVRRMIPLARALFLNGSSTIDPYNEFIGLLLSGFMAVGIAMIGPIFKKIFRAERELKESEQRFRGFFELSLVGVAIASADKRLATVNDRLCGMLGYSKLELSAMTINELTYPEDREKELLLDKSVEEGGSDSYVLDKRFVRKDGKLMWTSEAVRCVRDKDGSVSYALMVAQDISERKKDEEIICRSLREKETLLRELYHRTKNNMQMICALLNLESVQCGDKRLTELFNLIENRIFSMSLVHEKLYISNDLSNIDLSDYISDLCKLLLESYEKDSDRIDFVFDLETIRVPLDTAIPLGLILNETITNALKHAFPDNRKGRIRIGLKKTERDHFDLFIVDDGVGVAPEFKLEDAESIGLKTVFTLAEQIRATVRVTTDSGIAWRISFKNIQVAPRI